MSAGDNEGLMTVLAVVKGWSVDDRFALIREILATLPPKQSATPPVPRGRSADEIIRTFLTESPAPDDATVRQWIHDHRMEKYG